MDNDILERAGIIALRGLYKGVLNKDADDAGLKFWLGVALNKGFNFEQIVREFARLAPNVETPVVEPEQPELPFIDDSKLVMGPIKHDGLAVNMVLRNKHNKDYRIVITNLIPTTAYFRRYGFPVDKPVPMHISRSDIWSHYERVY